MCVGCVATNYVSSGVISPVCVCGSFKRLSVTHGAVVFYPRVIEFACDKAEMRSAEIELAYAQPTEQRRSQGGAERVRPHEVGVTLGPRKPPPPPPWPNPSYVPATETSRS